MFRDSRVIPSGLLILPGIVAAVSVTLHQIEAITDTGTRRSSRSRNESGSTELMVRTAIIINGCKGDEENVTEI